MSSTPPTKLGKYQIIREIARSNDIVYEAYDQLMNRRVALKELALPGGSTPAQKEDRVKRFLREARAAGSLAHPNIMTVYEVGQENDRYFIAMEYLDGKTLRNELDTKGFLPLEQAVEVAKAVLEGLEYAHTKGVIHRDIKPDNIQMLSSGTIKLTDFGIARLTFEPNLTMDGQVFGTPSYMSPEQVVGRDIDARSDLFSVGVVLYEMLSGTKPFQGDSVVTITYSIMNKNPDRPQQINWSLWQVVEKAMDKSPQLRHRSAREFIEALDEALHASVGQVIDPRSQPPAYQPPTYAQPPPQQLYPASAYGVPVQPPYGGQQIMQQPTASPYGNQIAAGVQPPYVGGLGQQGQGQQIVPPAYGAQIPVYYPPPPRKPIIIFSPQTKRLIAQVFIYTVLFVALGGLVFYIFDSATRLWEQNYLNKPSPGKSATSQTSGGGPATNPADPADQWNADGQEAEKTGDLDLAERDYRQAITANARNPNSYLFLGTLLASRSDNATDDFEQREKIEQAADTYAMASQLEPFGGERDHANARAAECWLKLARMYSALGEPQKARDTLYKAIPKSHSDPQLEGEVRAELAKLSGSE